MQVKKRIARAAIHVSDRNVRVAPRAVVGRALTVRHRILGKYPLNPMAHSGDRIATRDTYEAELHPEMQFMNYVV